MNCKYYSISALIRRATKDLSFNESLIVASAIVEMIDRYNGTERDELKEKYGTLFSDYLVQYVDDIDAGRVEDEIPY